MQFGSHSNDLWMQDVSRDKAGHESVKRDRRGPPLDWVSRGIYYSVPTFPAHPRHSASSQCDWDQPGAQQNIILTWFAWNLIPTSPQFKSFKYWYFMIVATANHRVSRPRHSFRLLLLSERGLWKGSCESLVVTNGPSNGSLHGHQSHCELVREFTDQWVKILANFL